LSFIEDTKLPTLTQFEDLNKWFNQKEYYESSTIRSQEELETGKEFERECQEKLNDLNTANTLLDQSTADAAKRKTTAEQNIRTRLLEVKTWDEKIQGIKIAQYHQISDALIDDILRSSNSALERYSTSGHLDTLNYYQREVSPIDIQIAILQKKISDWEDPFHVLSVDYLKKKYEQSKAKYLSELGKDFDESYQHPTYTSEMVDQSRVALQAVETSLQQVLETRIQKILPDNELLKSTKDIETIARELLPNVFDGREIKDFEGNLETVVTGHLNSINEGMKQIDEHKIRLISSIFNKVSDVYYEFDDKIKDIKKFFDEKEITGGMKVKIEFRPSTHYPIDWINSLKKQIGTKSLAITPLFKNQIDDAAGAEEIIINTFRQYSDSKVKDPDIRKLTNPKSYFDVDVSLVRPTGEKSDGSSGQDYAKIALLCIARLSRIERNKSKKIKGLIPGVRFMPIDEVAGLGGNFNLLYQIAEEYDYQILTMTISPDLVLEEGKQYVYILNSNKQSNVRKINLPPFGMFSNMTLQKDVAQFIKAKANAKGTDVANN